MQAGDAATGANALSTLYASLAGHRIETDLPALFEAPGVALAPDRAVAFGNRAPLAGLPRAITRA